MRVAHRLPASAFTKSKPAPVSLPAVWNDLVSGTQLT